MMTDEMGTFRVDVQIENPARPGPRRNVAQALVDTGAVWSCIPAAVLEQLGVARERLREFRRPDGSTFARWSGGALLHVAGRTTVDDVVFGEPADQTVLGWHTLSGLNLRVDPVAERLVDAGPAPAAVAA